MSGTIYDKEFYESRRAGMEASARRLLSTLFSLWRPSSLADFGCGTGIWAAVAAELGVTEVLGLDGDWIDPFALAIPAAQFRTADLSAPIDLGRRFDLAISLEVAEHLPPESAPLFVESLVRHADLVLFSAAIPFQGGMGHLNENWMEYWAGLFAVQGYEPLDLLRPLIWNDAAISWWYRQNAILFRSRKRSEDLLPGHLPVTARTTIHPELYLGAVRRRQLAPFRTDMEQDMLLLRRVASGDLTHASPGYGSEFDYAAPPARKWRPC